MLDNIEMNKLKRVYIEISNICNLQCSFCPVVERDKQVMPSLTFEEILQKVAPFAEEVCLHLMGEPLAHPEFPQILSLAQKYNVLLNLTTNGILIPKYESLILENPNVRQINFSLHSFKDNFRDKPIAPYLMDILSFSEHALEKRPDLYMNYRLWTLKENLDVTDDNREILELINHYFQTDIQENVDVSFRKNKKVQGRLYVHFDSRFTWPSPLLPKISETGTCQGVQSHLGIHADGTVVPCCLDKEAVIKLGNIKEESFSEIYLKERTQNMLNGFLRGELVEDMCQKCPFIQRFQNKAQRLQKSANHKRLTS